MAARNHLVPKTSVKAVGFDLDETLIYYPNQGVDWTRLCPEALKYAAAACLITPTAQQIEAGRDILSRYAPLGMSATVEMDAAGIFAEIFKSWSVGFEQHTLESAIDSYFDFFAHDAQAYPEVAALLKTLGKMDIKIGALTDVPYGMPRKYVVQDLECAGITQLRDATVTSVEVGARKPHPNGFLALARFLGVAPEQTVYVGSDRKNIEGANCAGMISVLLDRNERNLDFGQQFSITELDQLLDYL